MRRALIALAVTGCGFAPTGATSGDARTDGAPGIDGPSPRDARGDAPLDAFVAPDAPRTCMSRWHEPSPPVFTGVQTLHVSFAGSEERDPALDPTGLILYFSSDAEAQTQNFWRVQRDDLTDSFGLHDPEVSPELSNVNSSADENKLTELATGLDVIFSSTRSPGGDLWHAHRTSTSVPFGTPDHMTLDTVNMNFDVADPALSASQLALYYVTDNGGTQHIVVSTRTSVGQAFGSATSFTSLDSGEGDADPAPSDDETVMVFSSQRTGSRGTDLWYATRAGATGEFEAPQLIGGDQLNTSSDEGDPVLSADGCTLYFATNRAGDYDLWTATMDLAQ